MRSISIPWKGRLRLLRGRLCQQPATAKAFPREPEHPLDQEDLDAKGYWLTEDGYAILSIYNWFSQI